MRFGYYILIIKSQMWHYTDVFSILNVETWVILHKEELEANWVLAQNKAQIAPIDPLR